jgi:hypothetical protein
LEVTFPQMMTLILQVGPLPFLVYFVWMNIIERKECAKEREKQNEKIEKNNKESNEKMEQFRNETHAEWRSAWAGWNQITTKQIEVNSSALNRFADCMEEIKERMK